MSDVTLLSDVHRKYLRLGCGATDALLDASEIFSVDLERSEELVGFKCKGIAFRYYDLNGKIIGHRVRLDDPFLDENGKTVRYLTKRGLGLSCYFVKSSIAKVLDLDSILDVTEGEKKNLANLSVSCIYSASVSLPGCWGFGGKELSSIWNHIPLKGRVVRFIPDSDFFFNKKVEAAGLQFISLLTQRGATVNLVDLRDGGENENRT